MIRASFSEFGKLCSKHVRQTRTGWLPRVDWAVVVVLKCMLVEGVLFWKANNQDIAHTCIDYFCNGILESHDIMLIPSQYIYHLKIYTILDYIMSQTIHYCGLYTILDYIMSQTIHHFRLYLTPGIAWLGNLRFTSSALNITHPEVGVDAMLEIPTSRRLMGIAMCWMALSISGGRIQNPRMSLVYCASNSGDTIGTRW